MPFLLGADLDCLHPHTCPESGKGCEELTKQQLFAQNLLDIFLTFHREALHQTTASDPQVIHQTLLVSDL